MTLTNSAAEQSSGAVSQLGRTLKERRSCVVYGPPGIGKTYTLRQIAPDAIWVELGPGDAVDRFVVTVAKHLEKSQAAIDALRVEDVSGSLAALDEPINGHMLVLDRGEQMTTSLSWADDGSALLAARRSQHLVDWLQERAQRHPTVIVCRGGQFPPAPWRTGWDNVVYSSVEDLSSICQSLGFEESRWREIIEATQYNPAAITLLSLSHRLANNALDEALEGLVAQAPGGALGWLASSWLPRVGGELLKSALGIVSRLPGAPENVLKDALAAADVPKDILEVLKRLEILEVRGDELWVMRAIEEASGAYHLPASVMQAALMAAAHGYLGLVPSAVHPAPDSARFVLEAHRLFVEIGDEKNARRTAAFHVGGLIELAKRMSQDERPKLAAELYADIERLLEERSRSRSAGPELGRLHSYATHYKFFNRYMAKLDTAEGVLEGYRQARSLWPDNALWYSHEIGFLFTAGRELDALALRREAYEQLSAHPQRDDLLTARPARSAWKTGRHFTALALLMELGLPTRNEWKLESSWDLILKGWAEGVELKEIPGHASTTVCFARPLQASLREAGSEWLLSLEELDIFARANAPDEAVRRGGDILAEELRRLIQAYADELSHDERRRKVKLLRYIDLLGSTIGLDFPGDRWLLGRLEGALFVPVQRDFEPLTIPEDLRQPSEPDKLWFARVESYRDGRPKGKILGLELAAASKVRAETG